MLLKKLKRLKKNKKPNKIFPQERSFFIQKSGFSHYRFFILPIIHRYGVLKQRFLFLGCSIFFIKALLSLIFDCLSLTIQKALMSKQFLFIFLDIVFGHIQILLRIISTLFWLGPRNIAFIVQNKITHL